MLNKTHSLYKIGNSFNSGRIYSEFLKLGESGVILFLDANECNRDIETIGNIEKINMEKKLNVPVFVNLRGFEIRVQNLMSDEISVKKDDEVIITNQLSIKVERNCISTNYNRLHEDVKVGNHIFVNCGTVDLEVAENEG